MRTATTSLSLLLPLSILHAPFGRSAKVHKERVIISKAGVGR